MSRCAAARALRPLACVQERAYYRAMATGDAAGPTNGTPLVRGSRRTDFEVPGVLVAGTDLAVGTLALAILRPRLAPAPSAGG